MTKPEKVFQSVILDNECLPNDERIASVNITNKVESDCVNIIEHLAHCNRVKLMYASGNE